MGAGGLFYSNFEGTVADRRLGQKMPGLGRVGLQLLPQVADVDPQIVALCRMRGAHVEIPSKAVGNGNIRCKTKNISTKANDLTPIRRPDV